MRALFTTWAWPSHLYPMVTLAWAMRTAGHDVLVASQPALIPQIMAAGLTGVATGEDVDHAALRARVLGGGAISAVPAPPPAGATVQEWDERRRERVRQVFAVFAARADLMVDDLISVGDDWGADVVVHEPTTYAGPIAAKALGIPSVRHTYGVDITYQGRQLEPDLVAPIADRLGLSSVDMLGAATVDPCPPSMQVPSTVRRRLLMRYVPYNGSGLAPRWLLEEPKRPRICVTWGTSTGRMVAPSEHLAARAVEALRTVGGELVVAVAEADLELLGPLPDDVRVACSMPLHLVLGSCDLVVHQGGMGTAMTATAAGVPQLIVPHLPDQLFYARQVADTGAAMFLPTTEATTDAIREAGATMLDTAAFAERARQLRTEIEGMPAPAAVARRLADLKGANDG
ncbi:MAG TPA: nucleotide disphospho-sugar-binding domain-containing protein [Rugosimonospora sp.]|nr:nucleotide disphospho-sugar-binding domain-containing protein [Rugosimonospora sp.]